MQNNANVGRAKFEESLNITVYDNILAGPRDNLKLQMIKIIDRHTLLQPTNTSFV